MTEIKKLKLHLSFNPRSPWGAINSADGTRRFASAFRPQAVRTSRDFYV